MNSAIGIVQAMVNVPHGLSASAFTTSSPSPASATVMMNRTAMEAETPATGPTSFLAISASEQPSRRTEATSTTKSCTAPAKTAPIRIQSAPGR